MSPFLHAPAPPRARALPRVAGISAAYQVALIGLMDDLIDTAGLDADVARRAAWLKLGLEGARPQDALPFVAAPPLVPRAAARKSLA